VELAVISVNDGSSTPLLLSQKPKSTGEPVFDDTDAFAWTLDSNQVVFFRSKGSAPRVSELYLIPASGGEARSLGLEAVGVVGFDEGLQLHPDGRSITYAATGGVNEPEIWVMEGLLESRGSS
jgi:hypothetical protein